MNAAKGIIAVTVAAMCMVWVCGPAFPLTCDECQEIEKKKQAMSDELAKKSQELTTAYNERRFEKLRDIKARINELRKELIELQQRRTDCSDACSPENIKRDECRKIKKAIAKLEASEPQGADQPAAIDDLYNKLTQCNKELHQIIRTSK